MKDKFFIPLSKIKSGAFQVGLAGEEMIRGGGGGGGGEGGRPCGKGKLWWDRFVIW
jgi:hypothetical protein